MDVTLQQFHSVALSIKGLLFEHNIYFESYPYGTAPREVFLIPQLKNCRSKYILEMQRSHEVGQRNLTPFHK